MYICLMKSVLSDTSLWTILYRVGKIFVSFLLLSLVMKVVFMLVHHQIYAHYPLAQYFSILLHGLPMDASVAGYLTAIPCLLCLLESCVRSRLGVYIQRIYYLITAFLLSFIYILDMALYGYWGFRLDMTPIFYFLSSPSNALASILWLMVLSALVLWVILSLVLFWGLKRLIFHPCPMKSVAHRIRMALSTLLICGVLFIFIRGGITASTMNVGRVYYSTEQAVNHACVNPCFSFLSSIFSHKDFGSLYRYMQADRANALFAELRDTFGEKPNPDVPSMLNVKRPNIVLIVLESFSAQILKTFGGTPDVAVHLDSMCKEGVLFTNFYANSFRTDRGLASILAGYPAQPTMSIMKYTDKVESMPMWPKVLKNNGYDLKYYYGGDADFTNMRSFLNTAGFQEIISDINFPVSLRLSKWGVHDEHVFEKALNDIRITRHYPYLKVIQTSSSHEPFDVPYHRLSHKRLNAFAYTDECLGRFIKDLRALPSWQNTLVIIVPDHLGCYPEGIDNYDFPRYHIPLVWIGGAVKNRTQIAQYGSQMDMAATLLSQLGLPYKDFTFSKDILNPQVPHFAFCAFPNAFAMIGERDSVFYNCDNDKIITEKGSEKGYYLPYGKALLQKLYDDIASR